MVSKIKNIKNTILLGYQEDHTILPTPGDPTKMILSTDDTNASPVSANLARSVHLMPDIQY